MTGGIASWPTLVGRGNADAAGPLRGALALLLVGLLGFGLAFITSMYPLPGLSSPFAVGVLLLFARRPQWLMVAFFTSLAIPIQHTVAGLPVNAADALLVLWCALWPFMMARPGAPELAYWRVPTLVWLIGPFMLAVVAAQIGSADPGAGIKQTARIVEWFVLLPLALTAVRPDSGIQRFAGALLMTLPCLFAIDGLYEYLNAGQRLTGLLGIAVPVPEGGDAQIRHTYDISGRAGSSFGGAQGLAMYLVMTMSFSIAHIRYHPTAWMRRLGWVCLAVSIGGLLVAQSRGGILGALALLLAMALTVRPALRWPLVTTFLFVVCLALLVLGLWPDWDGSVTGLIPGRPDAVLDRLIIWGRVWRVTLDHPFLGVGLGNFRDAFFSNEPWLHVTLAYPSLHAHNTYLELLADTGWIGLLAYLTFLVLVARRLVALWNQPGPPAVLTLAAIGSLAAYAVFAMVDMLLLQNMHMLLVLVLSLGLTGSASPMVGVHTPAATATKALP